MKIYIAGHNGLVGSALYRLLSKNSKNEIVVTDKRELNLLEQAKVFSFFKKNNFDMVYLAAAKVGGIYANNNMPAEFIYENLVVQSNCINGAFISGVKKLLFLGSSCIYPKNNNQPISEDSLLTGLLEKTNEPYAIAKIAGIKLCESYNRQYGDSHSIDYRSVMPTNLYGPGDNYHPVNSHVVPALIRRFHEAKMANKPSVTIWGSGKPKRELLHVDDMARACDFIMNLSKTKLDTVIEPMNSHINIGFGEDISIADLSKLIAQIVDFKGNIEYDTSKPDGTARKLLDTKKINKLGWKPEISLRDGLINTYKNYINSL